MPNPGISSFILFHTRNVLSGTMLVWLLPWNNCGNCLCRLPSFSLHPNNPQYRGIFLKVCTEPITLGPCPVSALSWQWHANPKSLLWHLRSFPIPPFLFFMNFSTWSLHSKQTGLPTIFQDAQSISVSLPLILPSSLLGHASLSSPTRNHTRPPVGSVLSPSLEASLNLICLCWAKTADKVGCIFTAKPTSPGIW